MSEGIQYDEAWLQRLLRLYSNPDIVKQREIILAALALKPNERVLDIGSGHGLLVEKMAAIVGPGGSICGIDVSATMIASSKKRCFHLPQVELQESDATSLPFKNDEFDAAASTQVYEYIEDIDKCLTELYRVLKPRGRAVVLCTDWDTLIWNTDDRERMNRILTTFEAHCADPRLPRKIIPLIRDVGFDITRSDVYTMLNTDYNENTYSYGVIDFIASYVAGKNGVTAEETIAWANELRNKGQEGDYFFSISRYVFLLSKPG